MNKGEHIHSCAHLCEVIENYTAVEVRCRSHAHLICPLPLNGETAFRKQRSGRSMNYEGPINLFTVLDGNFDGCLVPDSAEKIS